MICVEPNSTETPSLTDPVSSPWRHTDDIPRDEDSCTGHSAVAEEVVMTMPLLTPLLGSAMGTAVTFARWSVDRMLPDGGQRTARQNAWIAMSAEARLARDRREAEAALAGAALRAAALAVHPAQGVLPGATGMVPTV
jgi:hypothetical protein